NHPSVFVWVLASDLLPRPELEKRYLAGLAEVDPSRPTLAACGSATSEVSGPTGVKMNGPYDYVPPSYWYLDREHGGAFGFNTETGPGPQPPPLESIRRMLPEENWWPIDDMWDFHCGRNEFNTLDRYLKTLNQRYGEASDLPDFARKAQLANYEAMRAMFEAFSVRRPSTTGVIQWMLNSAWPEMYWQLYDHYLVPNGAFYGARNASRPVHVAYDYGERSVVVVNDTASPLDGVTARVRVFDLRSEVLFEESQTLDVAAATVQKVLSLPPVSTDDKIYFVDCRIVGSDGALVASNLYWLSTEEDVLDWKATEWHYTPIARYADLTALARLPEAAIEVEHRFEPSADGQAVHVTLSNPGDHLAFFIELKVAGDESGRSAAPVFWDDNYVSLAPGERREILGTFPDHALRGESPVFHHDGWNVKGR
ncbi:MAG: glycoside hydrolase family 2, partial [bacterium]|nr:glycoside hydrolase family 2 [bacterium]